MTGKKLGRPPLERPRRTVVSVKLTDEEVQALKTLAADLDMDMSRLIRRALRKAEMIPLSRGG
jgi:predicted transcriptional regulator